MALDVVFTRKCLIAAIHRASEGSLVVMAPQVGLETAGSVEALPTACIFAYIVPLSTRLALSPLLPVVGEVHNIVVRVVGNDVLLRDVGVFS
jgi:hypothetical protein